MALAAPEATYTEDLYRFCWPSLGVDIIFERFSESHDDIRCEATVRLDHPLQGGRLYSGRLLLIGPNSRRDVRRELENRADGEWDWGGMLEQACNLARERYRRGAPVLDLACVEWGERPRFLLEPYIAAGAISIPYGDGKTAKSFFVLRNCVLLAQQGRKSLYLDWEDDAETHAERLAAICNGLGTTLPEGMVLYQRRSTRLAESVRELRRIVAEQQIEHVVVDSLGMAAGDPNDHGLMLDAVRGARSLEVASTCIHHLPKDARDKTKPFGSVYASNEARLTWLFEKEQEEGEDELALVLTNMAFNRGRLRPKQAWKVRFVNGEDALLSVEFEEARVEQLRAFRHKLPQWQLIAQALRTNGRLRPVEIGEVLEAEGVTLAQSSIRTLLLRYEGKSFVRLDGGYWGALAQETSP